MKSRIAVLAAAVLALGAAPLAAQTTDHGTHASPAAQTAPAGYAMADGEVRRVDKETRKITIRHGTIANLDMPPMTMVFEVTDAAMLEQVKAGDKIRFSADKVGPAYTVTKIELAR